MTDDDNDDAPAEKPTRTFDRSGGDNPQRGPAASGFVHKGGDLAKEEDRKRKKQQKENNS